MKKAPQKAKAVAQAMSKAEQKATLEKVGRLVKKLREARTSQESFAYEVGFSRAQLNRYESGEDMMLSTFLKLLYGLEKSPADFFKELK